MKSFIFSILIFTTTFAWAQLPRSQVIAQRIAGYSSHFLGAPYVGGALGEGFGYDADPLVRYDAFDCTTFVETISALALAKDGDDFKSLILRIRYKDGLVDFKTRNHFTSLDWIPNNVKQGILKAQTKALFRDEFLVASTLIDKKSWYLKNHQMDDHSVPQISEIPYLPLSTANENPSILDRIPSGAIINIVRVNWGLKEAIGTDLDVSHQGFAIRKKDGILYFRNASSEKTKKMVVDEPLAEYLSRMATVKSIAGINVLRLL